MERFIFDKDFWISRAHMLATYFKLYFLGDWDTIGLFAINKITTRNPSAFKSCLDGVQPEP